MNNAYYPKPNSIEYPRIKVFVAYTEMQPATAISLIGYNYIPVETSKDDDFSYQKYLKKRWEEKETFITIEQDTVIWPGALEAIWDCPEIWCLYDAHLPIHRLRKIEDPSFGVPMACMKISAQMIAQTPNLWDEPIEWNICEKRLMECKIKPHQHFPSIVNANPALLGFASREENG